MPKRELSQRSRQRLATTEAEKKLVRSQGSPSSRDVMPVASGNGPVSISADERRKMIEIAAYYRATRRGSERGSPERDWLEAEAEVDRALGGR